MTAPVVVATGAVVRRGANVLLIRRGRDPEAGRWSVPGGRVEPGEGLRDAARREVHEETGLEVEITGLVGVVERIGTDYHYVVVDFAATCTSDDVAVAGDDAAAVAWVPIDELERWDLVAGLGEFFAEHGIT